MATSTIGAALICAFALAGTGAPQLTSEAGSLDNDDIGGGVTSANGPEAGVCIHNPVIDGQGRVWMTARVRPHV